MPKILIVENNAENRDSLAGRLQCSDFAVVLASDGRKGIAMVQAEKPDLVLMNINMPEMDGWETTRQIHAATAGQSPPVIALAEQSMPGDRERALEAGCAESVQKPIEFADLLAQIEKLLQARQLPEGPLLPQADCVPG